MLKFAPYIAGLAIVAAVALWFVGVGRDKAELERARDETMTEDRANEGANAGRDAIRERLCKQFPDECGVMPRIGR